MLEPPEGAAMQRAAAGISGHRSGFFAQPLRTLSLALHAKDPSRRRQRRCSNVTARPRGRWASFHIDVEAVDQTTPYNISLYFLDHQDAHIRLGVGWPALLSLHAAHAHRSHLKRALPEGENRARPRR